MISDRSIMDQTPVVAAIDFGTTYSGYAFSTRANYKRDPLLISTNRVWPAGIENLGSYKAPTSILFNKDMEFKAFGFEAEEQYAELCTESKEHDFLFFRHFKLLLHNRPTLNRDMQLESVQGVNAKAMTVFSEAIKYLKLHLLETVNNGEIEVKPTEIMWVLTVPAIWDDSAKQFMREAAEMAGIDKSRLMIALEPEVASIYCKKLAINKRTNFDGVPVLEAFEPNTSYMILDIGGGTTDITVHKISDKGTAVEVTKSSGGLWGGLKVDEEFHNMVVSIYGPRIMEAFHRECHEDSFALTKKLEFQKCYIKPRSDDWITLAIPTTLRQMFADSEQKISPDNNPYGNQVKFVSDKLRFQSSLLSTIFQSTIEAIVDHVRASLAENAEVRKAKYFFVVGGLSQSPVLVDALRSAFGDVKIIVPEDSLVAVLKGAVLFGHDPQNAITARISAYTYGIEIRDYFDSKKHREDKATTIDGVKLCENVFDDWMKENQLLTFGAKISKVYYPSELNQTCMCLNVFTHTSNRNDVVYVTDPELRQLGKMKVDIPDTTGQKSRAIHVNIIVGGTELQVNAVDPNSQQIYSAKFDFLSKQLCGYLIKN